MNGRFFLDTNIFVYALETSGPSKARKAGQLVREAVATRRGVVSFQVVQEFFNVALHRFVRPMSMADAEQYFGIVFRPLLGIHSSPALYLKALRLTGGHHLSWHDSLIVAAALESECEVLYTEDLQHGRRLEELRIENPFA